MINTPLGPGTRYPWEPDPNAPPAPAPPAGGGMPGAQPAITPGGAGAAAPGAPVARPPNVTLSPQEQQAILASLGSGYNGGFIVGGTATSQPKMGKNNLNADVLIDTGEYQITVQTPDGRTLPMTVTRSTDPGGQPTWIAEPPKDVTPTTTPKALADMAVKTDTQGVWYPNDTNNPGGGYHQILPPGVKNEDEEIKKAVDRHVAEGERNARQRNELATGLYATDDQLATIRHLEATDKVAADRLKYDIANSAAQQKNADQEQANKNKKAADDLLTSAAGRGLTTAQTAGQQATTAATQTSTDIAKQKLPGELSQQGATLAATQASTAQTQQATQIAGAPQLKGTVGGAPVLTTLNPLTGQVSQGQMDLAYQPKTQADIAARVGQIQNLMQQKGAEVQSKVGQTINGKQYTAEDALKEFNAWHDANVAPQQGQLQAAQEEAQFARAKEQAGMRSTAYQTALGAGNQQVSAFNAMAGANPVGPGYAEAMDVARQGKIPTGEQMKNAFTYQAPNPMDLATKGTMDALKYIDPTAAAANGLPAPNYQGMDIAGMLNRTSYMPGATAPPPAAGPPAGPVERNWGAYPGGPPGGPGLLPPGAAGVPGVDPRLSGTLNPQAAPPIPPPPTAWSQSMPNFGAPRTPWDVAPAYSPPGMWG